MFRLKKIYTRSLFVLLSFSIKGNDINRYTIQASITSDTLQVRLEMEVAKNKQSKSYFLFSDYCELLKIEINGTPAVFSRNQDTLFIPNQTKISSLKLEYNFPLNQVPIANGMMLRRTNRWYPHWRDELLTYELTISADTSQYIIVNGQKIGNTYFSEVTNEIHLLMLEKSITALKEMRSKTGQYFNFFRHQYDTSYRSDLFYNEFLNSYDYFSSYFGDTTKRQPMNIVEIYGLPWGQSLENTIIYGNLLYDTNSPASTWIPHEIGHQWWGNRIFFGGTMYLFLEESLTEFLKIQYIQQQYGLEVLEHIKEIYDYNMAWLKDKDIPFISEIHGFSSESSIEESIVIYTQIPYLLNEFLTQNPDIDLQKIISNFYHRNYRNFGRFDDFYNGITDLQLREKLDNLLFRGKLSK